MEPIPLMIYSQAAGLVKAGILKTEDEFKQSMAYANQSPLAFISVALDKETIVPARLARSWLLLLKALVLKLIGSSGRPARDFVQDLSEITFVRVLCTHVGFHPEAMILLHRHTEAAREKVKQRWTNNLTHVRRNMASDETIAMSEDDQPILSSLSREALKLVLSAACSSRRTASRHILNFHILNFAHLNLNFGLLDFKPCMF